MYSNEVTAATISANAGVTLSCAVRSACFCVVARRLKEFSKRTTFIRVSHQINDVFGVS